MRLNPRHFLRMSKWARNPPSRKRVILVFSVVAFCFAIYATEKWIGWPDSMSQERNMKIKIKPLKD